MLSPAPGPAGRFFVRRTWRAAKEAEVTQNSLQLL
jgi:hypothetical protein